jgi:hypothetical protein
MRATSIVFKVLGHIWMVLLLLAIVISAAGMFLAEPTLYHGWRRVADTFSPFNTVNWIVIFVCALPAIGLYAASDFFARRHRATPRAGQNGLPGNG